MRQRRYYDPGDSPYAEEYRPSRGRRRQRSESNEVQAKKIARAEARRRAKAQRRLHQSSNRRG